MNSAMPAPLDVKLMNMVATILFVSCAVAVLAASGWWLLRNPVFSIGRIVVNGDLTHTNPVSLRANVAPQLVGNFFTLNLKQAQQTFEHVPWIRTAQVRRDYPNGLRVELTEHEARAYWGAAGSPTLVNSFGEVFDAEEDDVEHDNLPRFEGPEGRSLDMLQMYGHLVKALAPLGSPIDTLALNGRGSWRVALDSGASVELGGGSVADVLQRVHRLTGTLPRVAAQQGRKVDAMESADLRHADGYALRLRGVTTVSAEAAAVRARAAARPAPRTTARPAAAPTTRPAAPRTTRQNN